MLAAPLEARRQPQELVLVDAAPAVTTVTSAGLPSVSVPVLSTTSVSTFSRRSSASAFLTRTPAVAPRPVPTMIDIGVASPSAHGHAMISTATALTSAWARRGSGPSSAQATNVSDGDRTTAGTNQRGRRGRPAAGSARGCAGPRRPSRRSARAACRCRRARRASRSVPVPLTVPPVTRSAGRLLDRHRLAGDHRLVDRAARPRARRRRPGPSRRAGRAADRRAGPASGTSSSPSVVATTRAVGGARPSSARIAALVRLRARSSSTCPSSTSAVIDRRRLEVDARPRHRAPGTQAGKSPGTSVATSAVDDTRRRRRARSA